MDRPEDWTALATFEGISLMVSRLSYQARRHQLMLERQSIEQKALYELCRDMLLLDWKQSPEQQLCVLIKRSFPLQGVALWNAYEDTLSSLVKLRTRKTPPKPFISTSAIMTMPRITLRFVSYSSGLALSAH